MAVYEGVYKSFLQGVSQQTPQEREDGQLGEQINMLSDPVTGLRRRGGMKLHTAFPTISANSFIRIVNSSGKQRVLMLDTKTGELTIVEDFASTNIVLHRYQDNYFKTTNGKASIRTTTARDDFIIVNTEKIPTKELTGGSNPRINPDKFGYYSVRSSQFSKEFNIVVKYGAKEWVASTTASTDNAAKASPEYIATSTRTGLMSLTDIGDTLNITQSGSTLAFEVKNKSSTGRLDIQTSTTGGYVYASGISRIDTKTELVGSLPAALSTYTVAIGDLKNSAYYQYNLAEGTWAEVGQYTAPYSFKDVPRYINIVDTLTPSSLKTLAISPRMAGDEENNPFPSFIDYGITGVSAYQSRLILLSGSYVCMSKTTDFGQFMRTSVTELLDDDSIEISSAALSAAQFEYAIPYNKDLILISKEQQAVIPANSTVLTPKSAVIYPSTRLDVSLAVEPTVVGKTVYYTYQRGAEFYQVGEFIPNSYTDAQYYAQNLTDHLPLYAEGICTSIASSTTNNMVVMCSDTPELLINQFMWRGEERPLMSFSKWVMPYKVVYTQFLNEYLVLFMDDGSGGLVLGTLNVQLNQLDDKPVPYTDLYHYVDIVNGTGKFPTALTGLDVVATIYNSRTARHTEVQFTVSGSTISCPYEGRIVLGVRYNSTFTLTPPFVKDDKGKVIAGVRSTIQQLRMTFKNTGTFNALVQDTMGTAYTGESTTALTWSETDLGYTWINSIGTVTIPCRTRLASTECSISTEGTTDLNLVSTEYVLRMANKRKRI